MISVTVDTSQLRVFAQGFGAAHKKAMKRAFQGEAFRLKEMMRLEFEAGIGPPREPLTRQTAKTYRSETKALRWLSRRIAYRVEGAGQALQAVIGPTSFRRVQTEAGTRMHLDTRSLRIYAALVEGGGHRMTRERQLWAIYKIRKNWGEPVINPMVKKPYGKGWHKKRQAIAAGRRKWKEIPTGWIPKVGARTQWASRRWVDVMLRKERARSPEFLGRLYEMALAGERWGAKGEHWWTTNARFADLGPGFSSVKRTLSGTGYRDDPVGGW